MSKGPTIHTYITSTKRWVEEGGQMLMIADKQDGWGWQHADAGQNKDHRKKDTLFHFADKKKQNF